MTERRGALRVALLVPVPAASRHVVALLEWAADRSDIDISHIVVASVSTRVAVSENGRQRLAERLRRWIFAMVVGFERRVLGLRSKATWRVERCSLAPLVANRIDVTISMPTDGASGRVAATDVLRIKSLEFDLIVCIGAPRLGGDILGAARLGMIGVIDALDPETNFKGAELEGFWEVVARSESTRFGVFLRQDGATDVYIACGACQTADMYLLNRASMVRKTFAQLKVVLDNTARDGALPAAKQDAPNDTNRSLPGVRTSLHYLVSWFGRMAIRALLRRLKFEERWNVSYVKGNWRTVDLCEARALPWLHGRFLADPFVIERDGRTFLFVEDFVYRVGRGHITVFELRIDGPQELGVCLQEPFHLSFPYLFEFEGKLYMCPETNEAHQVRVYCCEEFPLRWRLAAVIMDQIDAADPMLFERDGRWWLLLNRDYAGDGDFCWALDLYSADSPLSTNWTPHRHNPICTDSARARNGGFLVEGEHSFRAGQRQGFDLYGAGLSVFEMEVVSPNDYCERLVRVIKADFHSGLVGAHHLNSTGSVTVVDHLSWSYIG